MYSFTIKKLTNKQLQDITNETEDIAEKSNKLNAAVTTIAAVTEENTAATEEIAASSSEVNKLISNIGALSTETAEAVSEVKTGSEEIVKSSDAMTKTTEHLAKLVKNLDIEISKFKV